ncbi:hypothetical protein SALB_04051 [Streptomyces noursei]|uniref:Uncharacterized protein n=1 Tax=Streptomyces noursei TaxID=1971 RepID=A0A401R102_STRNR|nr:hypothetical protein SALB_04051 [Streptomyces noursei]
MTPAAGRPSPSSPSPSKNRNRRPALQGRPAVRAVSGGGQPRASAICRDMIVVSSYAVCEAATAVISAWS